VIDWLRQQLSGVKIPRRVEFMAELPRHPTGKLYKRLLHDRYRQPGAAPEALLTLR
jgi:acyl-CoA synthetase (AMP-forming)/AMP-acid ligase II